MMDAPSVNTPPTASSNTSDASTPASSLSSTPPPLPYWLVNVPPHLHPSTPTCPPFLAHAGKKDQWILSQPDETYELLDWPGVLKIIHENRLGGFQRKPSDLRRYLEYIHGIKRSHGSVMAFILSKRLQWTDLTPCNPAPFAEPADIKILPNDWPYGLSPGIVHLVVWTKFELDEDPATDDLTSEARQAIDAYVERTFRRRMPAEKVVWFKNWGSLKSVRSVEHFHVLLRDPDPGFVKEVTGGVRAMCDVVADGLEQYG